MKNYSKYILLILIMFFQLALYGAYIPIISLYLTKGLGLTGDPASNITLMPVIASIISPLLASLIADKFIKARHLLSILHIAGAVAAFFLSHQTEYMPFLLLYFAYAFITGPSIGLVNAVTFKNLGDKREHFGVIRVFGTIGWALMGVGFGFYLRATGASMSHMFLFASAMGIAIGLLALLLPDVPLPPQEKKPLKSFKDVIKTILPIDAFKVLMRPEFVILTIVYTMSSTMDKFYMFGTAPFLSSLGYTDGDVSSLLPFGQILEIVSMPLLGFALKGLIFPKKNPIIKTKGVGFKAAFLFGLGFQILRFSLFRWMDSFWGLAIALLCNGLIFTFFYSAATIYVDNLCDEKTRTGVHQLIGMIFMGLAGALGNKLAGATMEMYTNPQKVVDYGGFWLVPTAISVGAFLVTLIFMKNDKKVPAGTPIKDPGDPEEIPRESL